MYNLFNQPYDANIQQVSPSGFERVKNVQRENCKRVISHYRRNAYSVESDHFLVRLLQTLPDPGDDTLLSYRDRISDYTDQLTRHFNLTSPVNVGESVFPGYFMGEDSEEILITAASNFDTASLKAQWQEVSPLRFLRHPKTDMNLMPPMGESTSDETGPSVILIDIPLLACQYQLWRQRELKINPQNPRTTMQFVANFPIPNSLQSWQDVAYFNQFYNLYKGRPLSQALDSHPFYLNTRMDKMAEYVSELLDTYGKRNVGYAEVIQAIEGIHTPSLRATIAIPPMAFTRQVIWGLVIARIPVIGMMLQWHQNDQGSHDRQDMNTIRRTVRRLRSERALESMVSSSLYDQIDSQLESDIKAYI